MIINGREVDLIPSQPRQVTNRADLKKALLDFKQRHPELTNSEIAKKICQSEMFVEKLLNG